jgi:hypothetical protein
MAVKKSGGSRKICFISVAFLLILFDTIGGSEHYSPVNVRVVYSERSFDITWDSIPGALGYNIYTGDKPYFPAEQKRKINRKLITSGTHFTYLWDSENGQIIKRIKGYRHYLALTAVYEQDGLETESAFSREIDNNYFEGFGNCDSSGRITHVFIDSQRTAFLPVKEKANSRKQFIRFMKGPGRALHREIQKLIDPKETGGCVPISTIALKLMDLSGLDAYRIEGLFIEEFHSFIMLRIEGSEYIVDFTADQFIPGVSPVVIPRDFCFLNARGKPDTAGQPIYLVNKIFNAHQIGLSDNKKADIYKEILNRISSMVKP